jgi:hypothetical protein
MTTDVFFTGVAVLLAAGIVSSKDALGRAPVATEISAALASIGAGGANWALVKAGGGGGAAGVEKKLPNEPDDGVHPANKEAQLTAMPAGNQRNVASMNELPSGNGTATHLHNWKIQSTPKAVPHTQIKKPRYGNCRARISG